MDRSNQASTSLNKYISSTGICSRREADKMIAEGRVTINGITSQLGNRVFDGDIVCIDGNPVKTRPAPLYIAFNKPSGIVSTTDISEAGNIISYIGHPQRLFPIGRLDKYSQGLIFLTNDGDIVNKILRAGNNHEKEYIVTVHQKVTSAFTRKMREGIPILGTVTKRCKVTQIDDHTFKIILTQGLNRQIRRMCEYLNYDVRSLRRTRIMNVKIGELPSGEWRELTTSEIEKIHELIALSSKTEEASMDVKKKYTRSKRR